MSECCCGTCIHHAALPLEEWCCDNEESDNYGLETGYADCCPDYEGGF